MGLRLSLIAAALALVLAAPARAADDGWHRLWLSVADLEASAAFHAEVLGFATLEAPAPLARATLDRWGLGADVSARATTLAVPGTTRGHLILVTFAGPGLPAAPLRSSARTWDTGGFSGFNLRVGSIEPLFREMQRRGWHGHSDPVTFELDRFAVREALLTGPDGTMIGPIERLRPELEPGWRTTPASRPFNLFMTVRDFATQRAFLTEALGFTRYLHQAGPAAEPGPNIFGLPHEVVAEVAREVEWLHPRGENEGAIAIMVFEGATGRSFAESRPPGLGLFMAGFPVSDPASACARASDKGVPLGASVIAPYASGLGCIVETPEGGWIELYPAE